jgi:hypothetical protein
MSKKAGVLLGKVVLRKSLVPRMSCDERTEGIKTIPLYAYLPMSIL